jgi:hypothetical protein
MKITAISKTEIRNDDFGDYYTTKDGTDVYEIRETGNECYHIMILIHELIEYTLLKQAGIPEEAVNKFDAEHPECDEPGALKDAPYYKEHKFATKIEKMLCKKFGYNWNKYEDDLINIKHGKDKSER